MTLTEFENKVAMGIDNIHFSEFRNELQSIKAIFRERFLSTLNLGFSVPEAIQHIETACRLPDKNYARYIKFVASRATFQPLNTLNILQSAS